MPTNVYVNPGLEPESWHCVARVDGGLCADELNADDVSTAIASHVEHTFGVRTMREAIYPTWRVFARCTEGRARLIRTELEL